MRKVNGVVAAALVVLGVGVAAAGDRVNALAKRVPAESLVFVAYDGNNPDCKKTALYKILAEPELKAVFEAPLAELRKLAAAKAKEHAGLDTDVLMPLLRTKVGAAFIGLAPPPAEGMPPQPELLLFVEVGRPDSPAAKAVNLLIDFALKKAGLGPDAFKAAKVGGVDAMTATINGVPVGYATVEGCFLLGTGGALMKCLDANTTKLAAAKEFQRVTKLTGGNEVFVAYYNHAATMQRFGMFVPPPVSRFLLHKEFGLANVKSISVSVAPDGAGFRSSLFIHTPGGPTGVLKLLAGKPLDPGIVRLAPKGTEFFCATHLDVGAVWDFVVDQVATTPAARKDVEDDLAQANREVGFDLRKDLVGSLGNEFAVFGPGFHAVIRLKDPAQFAMCLNKLAEKAAAAIGRGRPFRGAQLALRTLPYRGRTISYVDGQRLPLAIQPCFTMVGEYAVFALYPMALKQYINTMAGGATLADNADFAAVRGKVGKDVAAMYYADTREFVSGVYRVLPFLVGLLKMVPPEYQGLCPDPAKLPPPEVVTRHLYPCIAARRGLADGVLVECHSPIGVPTPPAMQQGGGIATMAILAGMLLPALGRARDEARKVRGMSNLKQIAQATNMWLLRFGDNTKYPRSLKALVDNRIITEPKLFLNPAGNTRLRPGQFVSDYESLMDRAGFQLTEAQVPMTLPLAWDKRRIHPAGRNVVFFDAHVEFMPEGRFQQTMRQVDAWIAKNRPKP